MRKTLLAVFLIVMALSSLPLMAQESTGPDTFFVLSRPHDSANPALTRVFAADPQAERVSEIAPGTSVVFARQIMIPGESQKSLLYSLSSDGTQTVDVFDRSSHDVICRFDAGYVPPYMVSKACFWSIYGDRAFFFGNFGENGVVSSYDWKTDNTTLTRLDRPILDAATDEDGSLYVAEPGKIIRQYSLPGLKRLSSISHRRDLWGVARIGHEAVLLERKPIHGTRNCYGYVTRFGRNLIPKDEVKLGLCSDYSWQGENGVLIIRSEPFLSVKSRITLIGQNDKQVSIPITHGSQWQLDPSLTFIYGTNSGGLTRVNLGDFSVLSLKVGGRASSHDLRPSFGGESGIMQRKGSRKASVIDFGAKAAMRVDVERRNGSVVYLPGAKRVAVYDPRNESISCYGFPGGEPIGVIDGVSDGMLLFPLGDGRRAILVSRGSWQVFDSTSLALTPAFDDNVKSPTPHDVTCGVYSTQSGSGSGRLIILRSDGACLVSLPELRCFWMLSPWGASPKGSTEIQLVGETRSSL